MPPDERPGEALAGAPEQVNLEQRFVATVQSVWALASQISTACTDNPDLCAATTALAQTAAQTGQTLVSDAKATIATVKAVKPAAPVAARPTWSDAPTHDDPDGRVGLGQDPA